MAIMGTSSGCFRRPPSVYTLALAVGVLGDGLPPMAVASRPVGQTHRQFRPGRLTGLRRAGLGASLAPRLRPWPSTRLICRSVLWADGSSGCIPGVHQPLRPAPMKLRRYCGVPWSSACSRNNAPNGDALRVQYITSRSATWRISRLQLEGSSLVKALSGVHGTFHGFPRSFAWGAVTDAVACRA